MISTRTTNTEIAAPKTDKNKNKSSKKRSKSICVSLRYTETKVVTIDIPETLSMKVLGSSNGYIFILCYLFNFLSFTH